MGKRGQTKAVQDDPFGFGAASSIPASVFKAGRSVASKRAASKVRAAGKSRASAPSLSPNKSSAVNSPISSPALKSTNKHAAAFALKTSTPMGFPAAVAAGKRAGQLPRPHSNAGARPSTSTPMAAPAASGRADKLAVAGRGVGGKENSGGRRSLRAPRPGSSAVAVSAAPSPLNLSEVLPAADASAMDGSSCMGEPSCIDTSVYDIELSPTAKPASPKSRKSRKASRKGKKGKGPKDTSSSRTWEAKLHFDSPTKKAGSDPDWARTKDEALSKLRAQFASIDDHSFEEELI